MGFAERLGQIRRSRTSLPPEPRSALPLQRAGAMPHLARPSTDYAEDALLPGDPGRALALAQQLLTEPRMSNHARGLRGYTGETPAGRPLSIQSTGMGGPSAAIVLQELRPNSASGARSAWAPAARSTASSHGDLIVVGEALAEDGTSRALGADEAVQADAELRPGWRRALVGEQRFPVVMTDLFYDGTKSGGPSRLPESTTGASAAPWRSRWRRRPCSPSADGWGSRPACLLVVSDTFEGGRRLRIEDEALAAAGARWDPSRLRPCRASTLTRG